MKMKAISLILALALLLTVFAPGVVTVNAESTDSATPSGNGMVVDKTATANENGTYTITLEAYATGNKVVTEVSKDVPTDIVLVLDQSGSMAYDMGQIVFKKYDRKTNSKLYDYRHNGGDENLWYKLENGTYVSVSVVRESKAVYTAANDKRNNDYYNNRNNLYAKVGNSYEQVSVSCETISYRCVYTYKLTNGTVIAKSTGYFEKPTFENIEGMFILSSGDYEYRYYYTDDANEEQLIFTANGKNTTYAGPALYQRTTESSGGGARLDALKTAVTSFANAVNEKAKGEDGIYGTDDDVNHRIAVVGFASSGYNNTELLTGCDIKTGKEKDSTSPNASSAYYFPTGYEKNGAQYGSITNQQYKAALQDMNSADGAKNVESAFNALTAYGGTQPDHGLDMANNIFKQNPLKDGEKRNRIVIVFTDGVPTGSGSSYNSSVANAAITNANTAKNTYGATVYTIGIFSGADATSAGSQNGDETQKANWFMQKVSSNNGTVQNPSYYLSAGDAASLNSIFQQIANNIESGGSSTTLNSEAVVKDVIAPSFEFKGSSANDITIETYACNGVDANGAYTWTKNSTAMDAAATIDGDKVNVTGFDFAKNYVGTVTENGSTTYRGYKLVIKFNVVPKDGFLGGNDVYTNTSAGIYENASATTATVMFPQPQVNVPIKYVTVTATDKNVYLMGGLSAEQIISGATAKCGDVALKLTEDNFGLESWQNAYVDITVTYTDAIDNTVTDLSGLTDDTTYNVKVTVSPKTETPSSTVGEVAVVKNGTGTGSINVFKPELTYVDSTVYYGDSQPTSYAENLTSTQWKHGEVTANNNMIGDAPNLTLIYTADSGKIVDGKVNTKQDIEVGVKVEIGGTDVTDKTTFIHTKCDDTCTDPENGKFWLHVKTCTLTITKQGGTDGETYAFEIYKDGKIYTEAVISGNGSVTISELPVGTYSIGESESWSWRYTVDNGTPVTLSASNPNGTITCTNSKNTNTDKWLNDFSTIVTNVFGTEKN